VKEVLQSVGYTGQLPEETLPACPFESPPDPIYFSPMRMIYFPDEDRIAESIENDDPLLLLVAFDGEQTIIGNIDDCLEHHILLKKAGFPEADLEKYFRIVLNKSVASWTYVCPSSYLNIKNREFRLKKYYENGIDEITKALKILDYEVPIDIPERYHRHFNALKGNGD